MNQPDTTSDRQLNEKTAKISPSFIALTPLLLFLATFIGAGLYFQSIGTDFAFYQLPSVVAILPAIILGLLLSKQKLNTAIETFIAGIGHSNIIAMCLIYLLAGAFAAVAKATGGVDATVAMGLSMIPSNLLLPGFFLIAAFIATAMGTSIGTIAAVAPIALGVSEQANIDVALMAGTVIGGALFGDNLSIISDTTIAATRSQGCEMKDKFKENIFFALPACIITLALLTYLGGGDVQLAATEYEFVNVIPYLAILILAVSGLNVFVVLTVGILLAGMSGFISGDVQGNSYTFVTYANDIFAGFKNMQEIFVLSMLVGGLAALMQQQDGLQFISQKIEKIIARLSHKDSNNNANSKKNTAIPEFGIASLVALTNSAVANNTVSIIVSGDIAKALADKHNISPKRSASLLDIFACIVQGLIPYGAQALLAASIFSISPVAAITNTWYCMILAIVSVLIITLRK